MPLLYALHGTTTPRMSVYIEVGYRKVKISEAEMRVHRILPCVASTVMSAFIIHGDHTATEGPGYLLETGDPFGSVHSINVMIQNNGLLGGTSFDYHQDGHALDQPNPECLGYTHIAALYVDSRVCCS